MRNFIEKNRTVENATATNNQSNCNITINVIGFCNHQAGMIVGLLATSKINNNRKSQHMGSSGNERVIVSFISPNCTETGTMSINSR
jgi:hypothetical protein